MHPDHRFPESEEELRDWVAEAWRQGWRARRSMIGKPGGTINHEYHTLRAAFLASWNLPPEPTPPVVSVREAIQRLAETKE